MIAAGAVIEAGTTVGSGELWAGNPAKKIRELKQEERDYLDSLPDR
jgi:carbonic anhydrase/acetyltransferase-like protein (isoleucine patch superfamily)